MSDIKLEPISKVEKIALVEMMRVLSHGNIVPTRGTITKTLEEDHNIKREQSYIALLRLEKAGIIYMNDNSPEYFFTGQGEDWMIEHSSLLTLDEVS